MSPLVEGVLLLAAIVIAVKIFEYFKEKKEEKKWMQKEIERQGIENLRLKAMVTGKCPDCGMDKDNEVICKCGFAYVDGDYCYICEKYHAYEELNRCYHPVYSHAYICNKCSTKN